MSRPEGFRDVIQTGPEVDLRAEGPDGQDNMTRAVNWAMVMTHGPMPCEVGVRGVQTVQARAAE